MSGHNHNTIFQQERLISFQRGLCWPLLDFFKFLNLHQQVFIYKESLIVLFHLSCDLHAKYRFVQSHLPVAHFPSAFVLGETPARLTDVSW